MPPESISTQVQRLVLAGFMGSGKTTVGRILAERLGWGFADLDDAVAGHAGMSVPEIFSRCGEPAFRDMESEALAALLCRPRLVIALGGGAPETHAIQEQLAKHPATVIVHLHAPFEVFFERCLRQAQDPFATARPLLGDRQASALRYGRRAVVYASIAHVTADAEGLPEEVADRILGTLKSKVLSS